ncbi:MAG: DNA mismatch repair endonuclease MutL [Xanthomonadaceae bacterium]|nr:DNA mismatch repair endonuclease MutL [Xanthomonadaceae bacterium]
MSQGAKSIHLLDPNVAEKIAAGEVIERPASVVKELVENSIDAGATEIEIRLEDGGKSLIEISDNGTGIKSDELALAVQRHATSKISKIEDLLALSSLGFRGEALPSIRAVAKLEILSRVQGEDTAYEWSESSGTRVVTHGTFLSSKHGTRMRVIGLFSEIPVRLKFLKSNGAEISHVREWVERLALARPEIGFSLINDDKNILRLRPGTIESRLTEILADGNQYPVLKQEQRRISPDVRVTSYWLQGLSLPHTRKLIQIVNGRVLKDRLLQQATLSPFKQSLLPGQFPALFLKIELDPAEMDVNAHPTKTEVRFREPSKIFETVQSTLSKLIEAHGSVGYVAAERSYEQSLGSLGTSGGSSSFIGTLFNREATHTYSQDTLTIPESHSPTLTSILFETYIVTEKGGELWLIDQHAAHERIRYEMLKNKFFRAQESGLEKQSLLIPESIKLDEVGALAIRERIHWLDKLGFEAESFGDTTLLIRAIPSNWGNHDVSGRMRNLIEKLIECDPSHELLWDESLFEKMAMTACRGSIKAGDRINEYQASQIINQLFECEHPWNCPHGRPTVVKIPVGKFEEWFQRRV